MWADANGPSYKAYYHDHCKRQLEAAIVSRGTLVETKLIARFVAALEARVGDNPEYAGIITDAHLIAYHDVPAPNWFLDTLMHTLDEVAPEGAYFGPHKNDNACFGFFPIDTGEPK
jgi:hypothetical protein